jgi:WD40 repeat protein
MEDGHPVRSVAIHPDGQQVFLSRWEVGTSELWRVASGGGNATEQVQFLRPVDNVGVAAISPDGRWLASGSDDRNVHLWNLEADTPRELALSHMILTGQASTLQTVKISADSRWLVTSDGYATRVWPLDIDLLISLANRAAGRQLTEEDRELLVLTAPAVQTHASDTRHTVDRGLPSSDE